MAVTTSYPGVYIEELPSPVHTITGVATSITAFVGRALRGPTNTATLINGYQDYVRMFGGLWTQSTMSYAVSDFFANGGAQAVIVRVYKAPDATKANQGATDVVNAVKAVTTTVGDAVAAAAAKAASEADPSAREAANAVAAAVIAAAANTSATLTTLQTAATNASKLAGAPASKAQIVLGPSGSQLTLQAASEGTWGNQLRVRVDYATNEPAQPNGVNFNLTVKDLGTGRVESLRNLSLDPTNARSVDKVCANQSQLVRVSGALPTQRPPASATIAAGGDPFDPNSTANQDANSANWTSTPVSTDGSDGVPPGSTEYQGDGASTGIYALRQADIVNLVNIPPPLDATQTPLDVDGTTLNLAAALCVELRSVLLVDSPTEWATVDKAVAGVDAIVQAIGSATPNAALYFPWIQKANVLHNNAIESFAPSGSVAGIIAATDAARGVWKAPAGLDAAIGGVVDLDVDMSDLENGELNPKAVNCIRSMPGAGSVIWGARTLRGDDRMADQWKYLPVRRMALYIEQSLYRGTKWVVFEPNDEPLWSAIRLNVTSFMHQLFRRQAFQGKTPQEAYLVKCDSQTTTQDDIDAGIVNILVGFAPLKPAEFVVIQIQQLAGQSAT